MIRGGRKSDGPSTLKRATTGVALCGVSRTRTPESRKRAANAAPSGAKGVVLFGAGHRSLDVAWRRRRPPVGLGARFDLRRCRDTNDSMVPAMRARQKGGPSHTAETGSLARVEARPCALPSHV